MITNHKFLFRWIFIYFFLYEFPSFLSYIEPISIINDAINGFYHNLVPWFGKEVLLLEQDINVVSNGSGDRTYNYIQVLIWFISSFAGACIWTLIGDKKWDYQKLNYWLLVWVRFTLGIFLIQYGMIKVVNLQFPDPGFYRLTQTIGEMSPMGLAWTFLGYSKGYNWFIGLGEIIGGALLLHRRTTLLGAMISFVVVINIVAINMFFDVPVKLFSSHLLMMSILIMSPHIKKLFQIIFDISNLFVHKMNWKIKEIPMPQIGKWVLLGFVIYPILSGVSERNKRGVASNPMNGIYEVQLYQNKSDSLLPATDPVEEWNKIVLYDNVIQAINRNRTRSYFKIDKDSINQTMRISDYYDSTKVSQLHYQYADSVLTLTGKYPEVSVFIEAKQGDKEDFLLLKRGFRWINEVPFNR